MHSSRTVQRRPATILRPAAHILSKLAVAIYHIVGALNVEGELAVAGASRVAITHNSPLTLEKPVAYLSLPILSLLHHP
jgi:hypothetical protein